MRIAIDGTVLAARTRYTGAGQYAEKLIRYLPRLHPEDVFIVYGASGSEPLPDLEGNVRWIPLKTPPLGKLSPIAGHIFSLPAAVKRQGADLLHVPTVHTRPSLPPLPRRAACPLVVTLHDVIPITFYEQSGQPMPWRMRMFYRWNLRGLKGAARVITVSETAREEIIIALGIDSRKIVAIHNGIDFVGAPAPRMPGLPDRYVLFGGSFEPRKNLPRLLEAYDLAVQRGLDVDLALLVDAGSGHAAAGHARAETLACRERLHFFSGLSEGEVRSLYQHAELFVFPSLAEGFGFPPLQAMACGVPVIASSIPALHEVMGDAAVYVDPYSLTEIAGALCRVAGDKRLQNELAEAGPRRAAGFRWEDAARRTMEIYRAVVSGRTAAKVGG